MQIIKETEKRSYAVKIAVTEDGKEVGRARLYVLYNNLHTKPFGLLEDVFVDENYRGKGVGTKLVQEVMVEAKKIGCYKLIATVRNTRESVYGWYEKFGFKNYGLEFRINL